MYATHLQKTTEDYIRLPVRSIASSTKSIQWYFDLDRGFEFRLDKIQSTTYQRQQFSITRPTYLHTQWNANDASLLFGLTSTYITRHIVTTRHVYYVVELNSPSLVRNWPVFPSMTADLEILDPTRQPAKQNSGCVPYLTMYHTIFGVDGVIP